MKKVIIFYASYGGGHLSAAKSLQNYITKNYTNIEIELIDCMKYINKTIEKVSTAAYREMAKKAPWAWGKIYFDSQKGTLAHISSRANALMAIKLAKLLKEKKPDLIISTHPFGSQMCSYLKRKGKIDINIATVLTDFRSHFQWLIGSDYINYFFVSNEGIKNELISKEINPDKIFVTGIPISERFELEFDKKEILNSLNFDENKKTILFFGGGKLGLGKTKTLQIFDTMVKTFEDIQIIAISGQNESMKDGFEKIIKKNNKQHSIKIFEYTDKIPEFMSISDIAISKPGGLTSSEAMASGLPMVIISPIPGQEEENAIFLENNNVGVWIRKDANIIPILKHLLDNEDILNTMKNNTNLISKKYSTKNICKILFNKN